MTDDTTDSTLSRLLAATDLAGYETDLRHKLKLRNAGDLQYVEELDLSSIGMSRPEQKRLRKEYTRMFPSGFFGKMKKRVFSRSESVDRRDAAVARDDEDQHVIPIEKITLCKELGHGEFGSVWQASWKGHSGTDVTQVAVKCVSADKVLSSSSSFLQEAAIMTRMRHEHVVRLFGVVLDTKKIMMVSELATCGSLLECLHKPALRDSFPVHVLCDYAEQIAMGMAYLESQRLIHRDLAARNVLVFSPKKVKISDFGLSRSLGVGEDYYRSEFTPTLKLPIAWCAPECINFLKFTSKSDVWAYGVTLWEMFSYGEMPWKEKTGAQILEAIDRRREFLQRPDACPEDIYELMRETWTYEFDRRPTFADIVAQFPERRVQTVRAICDCRDVAADHLHFKKDDLIVVIHRTPTAYPDGYYWFGSLRNGKIGLFRPTDTVAHLGSEVPANNGKSVEGNVVEKKKDDKKNKKIDKESERERRKALISEPVGEVRHTCHVGIDGTAFGLLQTILQLDKKDLRPTSVSPSTSRATAPMPSPAPSHASTSSSVHLRDTTMRNGILKETHSLRDLPPISREAVSLRETISPPTVRAPSQPPLQRGNHYVAETSAHDHFASLDRTRERGSITPSAPPLSVSAANSLKQQLTGVSLSIATNNIDDSTDGERWLATVSTGSTTPSNTTSRVVQPSPSHSMSSTITMTRREPVPPPRGPIAAVYARGRDIPSPLANSADTILSDEIQHLDRDLTNFSLSTLGDFSDTRPLLDSYNRRDISNNSSKAEVSSEAHVRLMTDEEVRKIDERKEKEHRKVNEHLRNEKKRNEKIRIDEGVSDDAASMTAALQQRQTEVDGWSSAAQEAYKLLVECGTSLKQTSPSPVPSVASSRVATLERNGERTSIVESTRSSVSPAPPRPATPPHIKRISNGHSNETNGESVEPESAVSYSPQKRVHIIETKLVDGPARDMSPLQDRHVPAFTTPMAAPRHSLDAKPPAPVRVTKSPAKFPVIDERHMAYDNLNGFGAGARSPPPVPPKPKVCFVGVPSSPSPSPSDESPGAAPSIARSSLFKTSAREEVIKF